MELTLHHITQSRYLVMTNGSRWEPAPGEVETIASWVPHTKISIRPKFGKNTWDHELTNVETSQMIFARKDT